MNEIIKYMLYTIITCWTFISVVIAGMLLVSLIRDDDDLSGGYR